MWIEPIKRFREKIHTLTPADAAKGGRASLGSMTPEQSQERAKKAVAGRWGGPPYAYEKVAELLQTKTYEEVAEEMGMSMDRLRSVASVARKHGLHVPSKPRPDGWAAKNGGQVGVRHHADWLKYDTTGERCPCGLRIDKDHMPETCDLRSGAAGRVTTVSNGAWMSPRSEGG